MENYINIVTMPIVTTMVYWIMNLIKYTCNYKEKVMRLIPLMSAICGAVCGLIIYYAAPSLLNVDNVFVATIIGGASGLSATGFNQLIKQSKKEEII